MEEKRKRGRPRKITDLPAGRQALPPVEEFTVPAEQVDKKAEEIQKDFIGSPDDHVTKVVTNVTNDGYKIESNATFSEVLAEPEIKLEQPSLDSREQINSKDWSKTEALPIPPTTTLCYQTARDLDVADLNDAVDQFAQAIKEKLTLRYDEGSRGWNDPKSLRWFKEKTVTNAKKINDENLPEEVDLANYAMFCWYLRKKERD